MSDEEFHLILSEVDKYDQMKSEIRRRQKQNLPEVEKMELVKQARDKAIKTAHSRLFEELHHQAGKRSTS